MKRIKTTEAIGHVLCHDVTQIIKDVKKGPVYKKGHIITAEDIPVLLSIGKDHLYIYEKDEQMMHEDEAAEVLCQMSLGANMGRSEVSEGKIELFALCDGVFKLDRSKLRQINNCDSMMIATRHGDIPVKKGDKLAGMRIIPLVIEKAKMEAAASLADRPIMSVVPYKPMRIGIVTTGNEVYYRRIQDTFTPVILEKLKAFDVEIIGHKLSNDDPQNIESCIRALLEDNCELILCTGGMSVDPDDRTPLAIKNVTEEIITYGAPVLPGAMFMLAYTKEGIPVMGLPGCVMYARRTIFDLVLPRIMIGERLQKEDFTVLGEGGLCLNCPVCHFPHCGFGKGAS